MFKSHIIVSVLCVSFVLGQYDYSLEDINSSSEYYKKYVGTLTDGDIRRGLLLNLTLKNKVKEVCNTKSHFIKKKIPENKIKEIFELKKVLFLPIIKETKTSKKENLYQLTNIV